MRARVFRLLLASSSALLAFVLVGLLTAALSSRQLPKAVRVFIPEPDVAEALIFQRTISPEIQTDLSLMPNGRIIITKGRVHCTEGEAVRVKVEITQSSTGAKAIGHTDEVCTGEPQNWDAITVTRKSAAFEPGEAQACAVARTRFRDEITDTFSWCRSVMLVDQ